MKTILAIATAAAALLMASATEAAPYSGHYNSGHNHYQSGYKHYQSGYNHGSGKSQGHGHCQTPVYKVSTCEVNRYRQCRTAYDHCGHAYTYHVTVVTYLDHYSDGTSRTYTKVYS